MNIKSMNENRISSLMNTIEMRINNKVGKKQERTTFHRGATMKKQLPCIVPNCRSRFEE